MDRILYTFADYNKKQAPIYNTFKSVNMNKNALKRDLLKIKEIAPLVHNITNFVVMNNTANALLAIGASPVMAHAKEEMVEMSSIAGALVINIGTLNPDWVDAMIIAGKNAVSRGIPVVLDPVGAGATIYRTETCVRIMSQCMPTIIRGNGSEIMVLEQAYSKHLAQKGEKVAVGRGEEIKSKGVDSTASSNAAVEGAKRLAKLTGAIVSISGATDYITDGETVNSVPIGSPMMTKVTGLGCTASAITGAFAAVNNNYLEAATNAMFIMGLAGHSAAAKSAGPGSLQLNFLDELYNATDNYFSKKKADRLFKTPLYLVTDRHFFGLDTTLPDSQCKADNLLEQTVLEAVENGVSMVQLREKDCSSEEFIYLAKRLHRMLKQYNVPLIINDRIDVALAADAEGVHVGQSDSSVDEARRILGPSKIIGLSVETLEQAVDANSYDIDYIAVSPVFRTPTKRDTNDGFGIDGLSMVASFSKHPVVAIGGIHKDNASEIMNAGADAIAVVSEIMAAKEPGKATAELLESCVGAKSAWKSIAWSSIVPTYNEIVSMPFLQELETGALKPQKFTYYLAQDTLYLKVFGENMLKMREMPEMAPYKDYFTRFYNETVEFEKMLHQTLRQKLQTHTESHKDNDTMGTACKEYTEFLNNLIATNDAAKAAVAHLACFWVYAEVGKQLKSCAGNPYKEWIDGYSSDLFDESVRIYLDICCTLAASRPEEQRRELVEIFGRATVLEYEFWDYAYKIS